MMIILKSGVTIYLLIAIRRYKFSVYSQENKINVIKTGNATGEPMAFNTLIRIIAKRSQSSDFSGAGSTRMRSRRVAERSRMVKSNESISMVSPLAGRLPVSCMRYPARV